MFKKSRISAWAAAYCILFFALTDCFSQQEQLQTKKADPAKQEIEVIFRFSRALFESLTQQQIEMTMPIDRTVEGMEVKATVNAKGQTIIDLKTSSDQAEFNISVPGTAHASFHTDAGPAIAFASSVTGFASRKRIVFDGTEFTQQPTHSTTQSCASVNSICPKRHGPIGKVVRKVGWCIARKNIGKIRQAVDEAAIEILADTFDEKATDFLDKLNKISFPELEETVEKHFPETRSDIYHLATLPDSLIAGAGVPGAPFPKLPPATAHVELWIKTRPLEAAFLEMLVEWNIAHDLLKDILPEEDAKLIAEDLAVETVDGWTVLRIGVIKQNQGDPRQDDPRQDDPKQGDPKQET